MVAKLSYLAPEEAFLGLEAADGIAPEQARAVVIPFGLEATVTYGAGTGRGPAAILAASHEVEPFDEEYWAEPVARYGVATLRPPRIAKSVPRALDRLAGLVEAVMAEGRFPLVLGGEHGLTPGAVRPFLERVPDLAVLHFDAHADLRGGYRGEAYAHASAIRRVLDDPSADVISLGIRNISGEEAAFYEANRDRVAIHWARERAYWRLERILAPLRGRPVYLSVDLDVFDASVMPATGRPEPGGLFWEDVLAAICMTARIASLVGADIVELAPQPGLHACDFLAAKLAYKILTYAILGVPEKAQTRPAGEALH